LKSRLTEDFVASFRDLPPRIQSLARKNYKIWKENSSHPGLQFKRVGIRVPVYAVRIGIGWRALGLRIDDAIVWFWIGSHAEYDRVVARL
jgi:hypothetical protein